MCVTVCNIGRDQNQQFICNERKAAQLAPVFQTSNITTNNRFCNQINTYIMHTIRVYITNDQGPAQTTDSDRCQLPMQCFVIEYFCFWFPSSRSIQVTAEWCKPWSGPVRLRDVFSPGLHRWGQGHWHPHQAGVTRKWVHHDNTWQHPTLSPWAPLVTQLWVWLGIGQQGLGTPGLDIVYFALICDRPRHWLEEF